MTRDCAHCGRQFSPRPSNVARGKGKFCSTTCQHAAVRGISNVRALKQDAAYSTIHGWVSRNWGKADHCESGNCAGRSTFFEWANLDGAYRRERAQWAQLCRPCHRRYDIANGLIGGMTCR